MAYKIPRQTKIKKNLFLKERKVDDPYEIWQTPDGTWEWRVLKKWQIDDNKPYARWFCAVKSPYTYGNFDYGDTYVKDIKANAVKQGVMKEEFARDESGKISDTILSDYGKKQLNQLDGTPIYFSDVGWVKIKGDKIVTEKGEILQVINSDRKVNKIIFKII
jgi:hypothetical protein